MLAPSLLTAGGLYLTGPRINLWGLAFVAWLPLLIAATPTVDGGRRRLWPVYVGGLVYWVSVLAGLRHAHPLMFLPALAMAAYLAIFFVIIVWAIRRGVAAGWPLAIVFPWAVLTTELFRNYFATGISVAMLSHAVTSATWLIQPARIGGAYLVSVLIAFVTGSLADLYRRRGPSRRDLPAVLIVVAWATYGGWVCRSQPSPADGPTRGVLLVGLNEPTDYAQTVARSGEIFRRYIAATESALSEAGTPVHLLVWPESMFGGGVPHTVLGPDAAPPPDAAMDETTFLALARQQSRYVTDTAAMLRSRFTTLNGDTAPDWIAGGGVAVYDRDITTHSGWLAIDDSGVDYYGKHHLVMFGEYLPVLGWFAWTSRFIPPGMTLRPGDNSTARRVGGLDVLPNICIETAVERIPRRALSATPAPRTVDAIVTLTNDAWFDGSEIVAHHRRCGQWVAASLARPVLSAANGGPTYATDAHGRLTAGGNGEAVLAVPLADRSDHPITLYTRLGIGPHLMLALAGVPLLRRRPPPPNRPEPSNDN